MSKNGDLKDVIWNGQNNQRNLCYYCKEPITFKEATLDHKVPVIRGGTNNAKNLCVACSRCNVEKGDMTHREYFFYKSPLGFIMRIFFIRKLEFTLMQSSIIKSVRTMLKQQVESIKDQVNSEVLGKLEETTKERDRYRNHTEILLKRILLLEQHLKVEIVDGEYKKISKKQLDKRNMEKAIKYEKKNLVDPITGETHDEMMERLASKGLAIPKDN